MLQPLALPSQRAGENRTQNMEVLKECVKWLSGGDLVMVASQDGRGSKSEGLEQKVGTMPQGLWFIATSEAHEGQCGRAGPREETALGL